MSNSTTTHCNVLENYSDASNVDVGDINEHTIHYISLIGLQAKLNVHNSTSANKGDSIWFLENDMGTRE